MDAFEALDGAHGHLEAVLRRVGGAQWAQPTPCDEWNVRQVTNHIVAAGGYFMALLDGRSKDDALQSLLAPDVLQPDPVAAFVAQRPKLRAAFHAPGALDRVGHHVITDMTGAQLLAGCVAETAVHAWDIARGASIDEPLDPQVAEVALTILDQVAPILAAHGFAAPAVEISPSAPVQDRMAARAGRRP